MEKLTVDAQSGRTEHLLANLNPVQCRLVHLLAIGRTRFLADRTGLVELKALHESDARREVRRQHAAGTFD